jgi:regulator of replication initiation timing
LKEVNFIYLVLIQRGAEKNSFLQVEEAKLYQRVTHGENVPKETLSKHQEPSMEVHVGRDQVETVGKLFAVQIWERREKAEFWNL